MEMLDIYDSKRQHIGVLSRDEVHRKGFWHFTVHAWLYDNENIYFAKRSDFHKLYTTASGHVQANETLSDAFSREVMEEIGLSLEYFDVEVIDIVEWEARKEKNGVMNIDRAFAHITISNIQNQDLKFQFLDKETESIVKINVKNLQKLFDNKVNEIKAQEYVDNKFIEITITLDDFLTYKDNETPQTKYGEVLNAIKFRQNN